MPRRIKFLRHTEVYFVPSHHELTADERREAWYSAEERNVRLGADIRKSVRMMRRQAKSSKRQPAADAGNKCQAEGGGELCIRGLEHMRSSAHLEQRRINRDCVVQAVLEAQERQKAEGRPFCAMEVSVASSSNSQWARNMALSFGDADAAYVRENVAAKVERQRQRTQQQEQQQEERQQRTGRPLKLSRPEQPGEGGATPSAEGSAAVPSHRRRTNRRSSALMKALQIIHNSHSDLKTTPTAPTPMSTSVSSSGQSTQTSGAFDCLSPSQSTSAVPSINPPRQDCCDNDRSSATSAELFGHLSRMKELSMRAGGPGGRPSARYNMKRYNPSQTETRVNPQQA